VVLSGRVDLCVPGEKRRYVLVAAVVTFYFCFILFCIITLLFVSFCFISYTFIGCDYAVFHLLQPIFRPHLM
jgi:hypothetical protein